MVTSIQMLLARRILDMAYFHHYWCYGYLLSIIKMYKQEETCCYGRLASVIINSSTGLKCGLAEAKHHQATISPSSPSTRILRLLLNIECFAIQKRVKQKFSTWLSLPVITKYVRPYFSNAGRQRVNLGHEAFFLHKFQLLINLSTP